jgi:DNA-binding beta-propeller fold protein YncE
VSAFTAYSAYIANEASDLVTRVVFTPGGGLFVQDNTGVGSPGRIVGPHSVATAPDGRQWFVSLSHGVPTGRLARYSVAGDTLLGSVAVGRFPETIAIAPDGQYLFVTNRDQARGVVSGISVVYAATLTEVARPSTCARPRGGRLNERGTKHYSVCGAGEQLVEIDTRTFQVTHRFGLTVGGEGTLPLNQRDGGRTFGSGRRGARNADPAACVPSWVEPGRGAFAGFVYVACSARDEILEIDAQQWRVTRRFADVPHPYALDTDPAGTLLLATLRADSAVAVIDLATGAARARLQTSQASPHSIAITPDGRYAFVTSEGVGMTRGAVDVLDLRTLRRVESIAVGYGPGGVAVLPR